MAVYEAAVFLFSAQVGAEIGVAAVFPVHHGNEGTGGELPHIGAVGLAFPAHGSAVIGKEGSTEAGVVGKEEVRCLFVYRIYGKIFFQPFHGVPVFQIVGKGLGEGWAPGDDFHEPGALVVPFAVILVK